jgi:hypothetical protein
VTAGGITVRNVAETVIRHAYKVYRVGDGVRPGPEAEAARLAE